VKLTVGASALINQLLDANASGGEEFSFLLVATRAISVHVLQFQILLENDVPVTYLHRTGCFPDYSGTS
jgi:hypothetical protein